MKIGIRDLVRSSAKLGKYAYVDVVDKRSHTYKGLFVSPRYADEMKAYLKRKIQAEGEEKLNDIMQFAGTFDGGSDEKTVQELTAEKRKKYGE